MILTFETYLDPFVPRHVRSYRRKDSLCICRQQRHHDPHGVGFISGE
jgi:hypothetical protein